MTFQDAQLKLLAYVRSQIRNGELTERGFARLIGISQPHVHNVLKGVRNLSPQFLDLVLKYFHLTILDLIPAEELEAHLRTRGRLRPAAEFPVLAGPVGPGAPWPAGLQHDRKFSLPFPVTTSSKNLVVARLIADPAMRSTLNSSDIALLDTTPMTSTDLVPRGLFVVERGEGMGREAILRYVRPGARRYYLASDATLNVPTAWEPLQLAGSASAATVKARVRWLGREAGDQPGRFLYDPISW